MNNWKCSEDPNEITSNLTGQVSVLNVLQICRWANRKVGAIVPVSSGLKLYFAEYLPDSSRGDPRMDFEPEYGKECDNPDLDSHTVSCGGIVARWLLESRGLHPSCHGLELFNDANFRKNILNTLKEDPYIDTLYETHLEEERATARKIFESLQDERRRQLGAWKHENNSEFKFSLEEHLKEERRMLQYDERHLYPFFCQEDVEYMRAIAQDYQEYIQYKLNKQSVDIALPSVEKKKSKEDRPFVPTENTFNIEHTTQERLRLIFDVCIKKRWLDSSTRIDDWLKLFAGVPSKVLMVWRYEERPALRDLFKMMAYDKDGEQETFIAPRKRYLHIVSSHFVTERLSRNKKPVYITNFNCRHREGDKQSIELCRRILAWPIDEELDLNVLLHEMSEDNQKKEMIDEAQPDITIDRRNAALQEGQRTPSGTIRYPKH